MCARARDFWCKRRSTDSYTRGVAQVELVQLRERSACPVCGESQASHVFSASYEEPALRRYLVEFYAGRIDPERLKGQRYELSECNACTVVYQRWVPGESFLAELYDDVVDADVAGLARRRGLRVRQGYASTIEQFLKYSRKNPSDTFVLDFGAGWGHWLQMAAAYGCRTAAAELAENRSLQVLAAGHEIFTIDDLPRDAFDFINAEQVFEHLVAPSTVLRRLAQTLRPSGVLRMSVPNGCDIKRRLTRLDWAAPKESPESLNAAAPLEHLNTFNTRSLIDLGTSAGLTTFNYPARQYFDSWERIRFVSSAVVHILRRPPGTLMYFQRRV